MNRALKTRPAPTQQPQGHEKVVLRLADLPDVLTVPEVCGVLRISQSSYFNLKAHRAFPIKQLTGVSGVKYAKAAVERHLQGGAS